jgi:predicted secreted protein
MADSAAITGQGTIFKRNGAALSEINSINGPSKTRETIDVTRLEDEDGYRKFIGGLRNPGTIVLNMNFTRANYLLLNGDYESDEPQSYQIVLPDDDDTTFTVSGLVTELPLGIPIGDKISVDVTIQLSGKVNHGGTT